MATNETKFRCFENNRELKQAFDNGSMISFESSIHTIGVKYEKEKPEVTYTCWGHGDEVMWTERDTLKSIDSANNFFKEKGLNFRIEEVNNE